MSNEPDATWLQERLFERRIVLCRGLLDDGLAARVAAELMTLDALGDASIELQMDCQGASLESAWTLIDVIDLLGVPVNIVCSGRVEGAAVGVLAAGARRTALPHARFRLTDPELEISGRASELTATAGASRQAHRLLHERVAASTGEVSPGDGVTSLRAVYSTHRGGSLPAHGRDSRGTANPRHRRHTATLLACQEAEWQRAARVQARRKTKKLTGA